MHRPITILSSVLLLSALAPPAQAAVPSCAGLAPTIVGTSGDDTITGTPNNDVIVGMNGRDTILGGGGNDYICGGNDEDDLVGQDGDDQVRGGQGGDRIGYNFTIGDFGAVDEAGNDILLGGRAFDAIHGGGGNDYIHVGMSQVGGENVFAGEGDDYITGRTSFYAEAQGGNDTLQGTDGNDDLVGGPGADAISGGAGEDDDLFGGQGPDTIYGQAGHDDIWGADPSTGDDDVDTIDGGTAIDNCIFDSFDVVTNCP